MGPGIGPKSVFSSKFYIKEQKTPSPVTKNEKTTKSQYLSNQFSHLLPEVLSQCYCQHSLDDDGGGGDSNSSNSVLMCKIVYSHIAHTPSISCGPHVNSEMYY